MRPRSDRKRRSVPTSFQSTCSTFAWQYGHERRGPEPAPSRLVLRPPGRPCCFATVAATSWLERDVVLACRARHRRGLEVARVGRHIAALGREPSVAAPARRIVAPTEELHGVGNDIDRLPLVAFLVVPLAPLEAAVE